MTLLVGSVYLVILLFGYISFQEPPIKVDSGQIEVGSGQEESSLALYQRYYALQSQLDTLDEQGSEHRVGLLRLERDIKKQLSSNLSDIELHRRLIRTQNEFRQSIRDWLDVERSLDDQMDEIREELESRGEPPPG